MPRNTASPKSLEAKCDALAAELAETIQVVSVWSGKLRNLSETHPDFDKTQAGLARARARVVQVEQLLNRVETKIKNGAWNRQLASLS